jgi:hypothetical protein
VDWEEEVPGGRISVWGPAAYALIVLLLVLGFRVDRKPAGATR